MALQGETPTPVRVFTVRLKGTAMALTALHGCPQKKKEKAARPERNRKRTARPTKTGGTEGKPGRHCSATTIIPQSTESKRIESCSSSTQCVGVRVRLRFFGASDTPLLVMIIVIVFGHKINPVRYTLPGMGVCRGYFCSARSMSSMSFMAASWSVARTRSVRV